MTNEESDIQRNLSALLKLRKTAPRKLLERRQLRRNEGDRSLDARQIIELYCRSCKFISVLSFHSGFSKSVERADRSNQPS